MFHAIGLKEMANRERSREVLLTSTREWNWVRRTSIFLESIVNRITEREKAKTGCVREPTDPCPSPGHDDNSVVLYYDGHYV